MKMRIADYQDYKNIEENFSQSVVEEDETVCQVCGSTLKSTIENVGFDENPFNEIEYFCPNGCEQDELVVIL